MQSNATGQLPIKTTIILITFIYIDRIDLHKIYSNPYMCITNAYNTFYTNLVKGKRKYLLLFLIIVMVYKVHIFECVHRYIGIFLDILLYLKYKGN